MKNSAKEIPIPESYEDLPSPTRKPRKMKFALWAFGALFVAASYFAFKPGFLLRGDLKVQSYSIEEDPVSIKFLPAVQENVGFEVKKEDIFPRLQLSNKFFQNVILEKILEDNVDSILQKTQQTALQALPTGIFFSALKRTDLKCSLEFESNHGWTCSASHVPFLFRPLLKAATYFLGSSIVELPNKVRILELTRNSRSIYLMDSNGKLLLASGKESFLRFLSRTSYSETLDARNDFTEKIVEWQETEQEKLRRAEMADVSSRFTWIDGYYQSPSSEIIKARMSKPFAFGAFSLNETSNKNVQMEISGNFFPNLQLVNGKDEFQVSKFLPETATLAVYFKFLTPGRNNVAGIKHVVEYLDNQVVQNTNQKLSATEAAIVWMPKTFVEWSELFRFTFQGMTKFPSPNSHFGFLLQNDNFGKAEDIQRPIRESELGSEEIFLGKKLETRIHDIGRKAEFDPAQNLLFVATNKAMLSNFPRAAILRDKDANDSKESQIFGRLRVPMTNLSFHIIEFTADQGVFNATLEMR